MGAPPEESALEALGSTTGSKTQDTDFFATDLAPIGSTNQVNKITVTFVWTTVPTSGVEITFDGTNYEIFQESTDITANKLGEKSFFARVGDLINFRQPAVAAFNLDLFRVDTQNH